MRPAVDSTLSDHESHGERAHSRRYATSPDRSAWPSAPHRTVTLSRRVLAMVTGVPEVLAIQGESCRGVAGRGRGSGLCAPRRTCRPPCTRPVHQQCAGRDTAVPSFAEAATPAKRSKLQSHLPHSAGSEKCHHRPGATGRSGWHKELHLEHEREHGRRPYRTQPGITSLQMTLCLPFVHRFGTTNLKTLPLGKDTAWRHWLTRVAKADVAKVCDYSYFFVPEVRRLLFPEWEGWEGRDSDFPVAPENATLNDFREYLATFESEFAKHAYQETAARVTWSRPSAWLRSKLLAYGSDVPNGAPFTIDWADVLLLPEHVGVLIMTARTTAPLSLPDAAAFLRIMKKRVYRRRLTVDLADIETPDGDRIAWTNIVDEILEDLREPDPRWGGPAIAETFGTNFSFIAVGGVPSDTRARPAHPFTDVLEQACFSIATGHGRDTEVDRFSEAGMAGLRQNQAFNSWGNWRVLSYDDSLAITMLAGRDDLDRNLATITELVERAYCLMHGLLLAQRVRLHLLAAQVQATPTVLDTAVTHVEDTERAFVRFRRILWFHQVTTAPVGVKIYNLLRQQMELDSLSDFLKEELAIVKARIDAEWLQEEKRSSVRMARMLEFLTILGVPIALYLALTQPALNLHKTTLLGGTGWVSALILPGLVTIFAAAYFLVRRHMTPFRRFKHDRR
jgi:hypothetical protein